MMVLNEKVYLRRLLTFLLIWAKRFAVAIFIVFDVLMVQNLFLLLLISAWRRRGELMRGKGSPGCCGVREF